ncbi:hypothetical protein HDU77_002615 [Chytriomyces hyalinus]|nr:hypothetical protein HDU77_002615 [Chytriomyces hyalinus]
MHRIRTLPVEVLELILDRTCPETVLALCRAVPELRYVADTLFKVAASADWRKSRPSLDMAYLWPCLHITRVADPETTDAIRVLAKRLHRLGGSVHLKSPARSIPASLGTMLETVPDGMPVTVEISELCMELDAVVSVLIKSKANVRKLILNYTPISNANIQVLKQTLRHISIGNKFHCVDLWDRVVQLDGLTTLTYEMGDAFPLHILRQMPALTRIELGPPSGDYEVEWWNSLLEALPQSNIRVLVVFGMVCARRFNRRYVPKLTALKWVESSSCEKQVRVFPHNTKLSLQQRAVALVQAELAALDSISQTASLGARSLAEKSGETNKPSRMQMQPEPTPVEKARPRIEKAPLIPSTRPQSRQQPAVNRNNRQTSPRRTEPVYTPQPEYTPPQPAPILRKPFTISATTSSIVPKSELMAQTRRSPPRATTTTKPIKTIPAPITTTATGLSFRNKARETEIARLELLENDRRLVEAMRRLDKERTRADLLIKREKEAKAKKLAESREKRKKTQVKKPASPVKSDTGSAIARGSAGFERGGFEGEGVSLDFDQDDLFLDSESPPRGAVFYRAASPAGKSPPRLFSRSEQHSILGFYESQQQQPYSLQTDQKPIWNVTSNEMITLLDIPPSEAMYKSPKQAPSNIKSRNLSPAGSKSPLISKLERQETDMEIIIENVITQQQQQQQQDSHGILDILEKRFNIKDVSVQTRISQPDRIWLPKQALFKIRTRKEQFLKFQASALSGSYGASGEPVEAIAMMADELFEDLMNNVVDELGAFNAEFVQGVISSEFMDQFGE